MKLNPPALATLGAVALAWAVIWWLRKRQVNFTLVALIALALGVPIGLVAGNHVQAINPIGQIYINILLACVGPLILVAIVSAVTSLGSHAKLRSIGLRSILWLLACNALAVVLALGLGLAFQPGHGVHAKLGGVSTDTVQGQVQAFSQVIVGFFPSNVVQNFSGNDILPIILIALTLSVAYLSLAEKEPEKVRPFRTGAEALKLVIFKAVGYVIRLTPYAIVALTAFMVGSSTNLGSVFWSLAGLLALVWGACFLDTYAVNGVILKVFADVPVVPFFRKIFPAQLTAFTTQSSVGTLPITTARLTRSVGVNSEIAHFTAPLGTTIGMPGCAGIWPMLIAIWGINAYDLHYTLANYVVLALLGVTVSVGTAGVPGAATVAAATVLAAAGLPLEFVAVTIPIGMIADMARTATNVTAAAVSATVVARQTGMLDDDIFAGRAEFFDEDELAESEVVARPALERAPAEPVITRPALDPVPADAVPRRAALDRAPAEPYRAPALDVAMTGITQVEPEKPVTWESDGVTQRVELAPSGWGTKVTLTVTATAVPPADAAPPPGQVESRDANGSDARASERLTRSRVSTTSTSSSTATNLAGTVAPAPARRPRLGADPTPTRRLRHRRRLRSGQAAVPATTPVPARSGSSHDSGSGHERAPARRRHRGRPGSCVQQLRPSPGVQSPRVQGAALVIPDSVRSRGRDPLRPIAVPRTARTELHAIRDSQERKTVNVSSRWMRPATAVHARRGHDRRVQGYPGPGPGIGGRRMLRRVSPLVAGLVLSAAALAPAAHATDITNPAEHPYPITVTIDGQTYHDGLDTLPGYDDYACTPIPDVQYDFADNEILYYDDNGNLLAKAPWTEWSRISSYQTWLAQQGAAKSSGTTTVATTTSTSTSLGNTTVPTSTGTSTSTSTSSSTAATSHTTSSSTTKARTTKARSTTSSSSKKVTSTHTTKSGTSTVAKTKKTATTNHAAVAGGTVAGASTASSASKTTKSGTSTKHTSSSAKKSGSSTASTKSSAATKNAVASAAAGSTVVGASSGGATTATSTGSSATPSSATTTKAQVAKSSIGGAGNTRLAGAGILAALVAAGLCLMFGNFARRQAFGRRGGPGA